MFNFLRLGCISLLMNFVAILIASSILSFFVGQVGLGVSLVLRISLSIVVDNSIRFLNKFRFAN